LKFFTVSLIGLKRFATLLPNNWLTKTPEALALIWLGRKSAERKRISERGMCNDFHSRHSLSAGGPGASSALACGVSLATLFPQESRTFRSNQLEFYKRNIVGKLALFQFVYSLAVPSIF
jgi:hypothetical protein